MKSTALMVWTSILTSFACGVASADVRLPVIFGDHMVVQQQLPIRVWGWADPGEQIVVTLDIDQAKATADQQGEWQVQLPQRSAGGPFTLTVQGSSEVRLDDVLVGEVWLASGQSNMEWQVRSAENPEEEIASALYPQIRLFTVAKRIAQAPQDDCEGQWAVCSPETVPTFSATAYFFGRTLHRELHVPVGLINSSWGGTLCEAWTSRTALETDGDFAAILERSREFNPNSPHQASVLYNGMIHPLTPFAIRGAIWYQGESNVSRAEQYAKLFPAMIRDWRTAWGLGHFPFLYAQLAPFRYGNQDPRACAELWESQLKTLHQPNTGMAVLTDIGNVKDIHPRNKQEVGSRLARWALARTYGQQVVYSGPLYESMSIEGDRIRIRFEHVDGGLKAADGQPLTHFQISGADQVFYAAQAQIEGSTVVVHSDQVQQPVAVRFGWRDDAEPNLVNEAGLPASPFRTDDFPMVTAGQR